GDPHAALATARLAREELAGQGRHAWTPLADDVTVRARLALEPATPGLLGEALACADALDGTGWTATAAALRLAAARLAAGLGDRPAAESQLDRIIATCQATPAREPRRLPHHRHPASPGPLSSRTLTLVFHHAVALRRRLAGDHAGALAAVDAGLRTVDGRAAPSDIRAHAARPAEELAELGLELALHTGDPAAVLAWAERWRA